MSKIISKIPRKRKGLLMAFLLLGSMFVSEKVFSRNHWNHNYMYVSRIYPENSIQITFEFFDYLFGPATENGYLQWCDFSYSTDGVNYYHFMRAETYDQDFTNWSWLFMKDKLTGAKLEFNGCYSPPAGTMWPDSSDVRVEVYNIYNFRNIADVVIKWYVASTPYSDIQSIRINGLWHINGVWPNESINNETYNVGQLSNQALKSKKTNEFYSSIIQEINSYDNKEVKLSNQADGLVIQGANPGENIKVYTTSGVQIKSIVAKEDAVKIKLAKKQVYVVHLGPACYKVALCVP